MAQQQISTFTRNDNKFTGCLLVKAVSFGTTKTNKPFTNVTFMDPSGTIPSKLWDTSADQFPHKAGTILEIVADIDYYNNEPQLIVKTANILEANDPRNRLSYYLQTSPMSIKEMRGVINTTLDNIQSPFYKELAQTFLKKNVDGNTFEEQPAAKTIHHAYYRGLMYHTVRMLKQATALLSVYTTLPINKDLLYTAILIHDIGKLEEMSGFLDTEYTAKGTLLSHIGIADGWLVEYAIQNGYSLNDREVILLRHMILSHHGLLEYGSPTEPHIPEAELLHRIDDTDARMTIFEKELSTIEDGHLSKRLFGLGNRTIYKVPTGEDDIK